MDETIDDDGSNDTEEDSSAGQAGVDNLRLRIHLFSLFAIRERGEARTDEGIEEYFWKEENRCNDELPKCHGVDRLRDSIS